jgi:hypothetical protein
MQLQVSNLGQRSHQVSKNVQVPGYNGAISKVFHVVLACHSSSLSINNALLALGFYAMVCTYYKQHFCLPQSLPRCSSCFTEFQFWLDHACSVLICCVVFGMKVAKSTCMAVPGTRQQVLISEAGKKYG